MSTATKTGTAIPWYLSPSLLQYENFLMRDQYRMGRKRHRTFTMIVIDNAEHFILLSTSERSCRVALFFSSNVLHLPGHLEKVHLEAGTAIQCKVVGHLSLRPLACASLRTFYCVREDQVQRPALLPAHLGLVHTDGAPQGVFSMGLLKTHCRCWWGHWANCSVYGQPKK